MTNHSENWKVFKNRVKQVREDRGFSMQNLADECDTDASNILRLENGDRKLTFEWMLKFARALDCQPYDFLDTDREISDEYLETYYPFEDLFASVFANVKDGDPDKSYTAKLVQEGETKIAQKIGEEAFETVVAGLKGDVRSRENLVCEAADLIYHLMVMLAYRGIHLSDVIAELELRKGKN